MRTQIPFSNTTLLDGVPLKQLVYSNRQPLRKMDDRTEYREMLYIKKKYSALHCKPFTHNRLHEELVDTMNTLLEDFQFLGVHLTPKAHQWVHVVIGRLDQVIT